MGSDVDLSIIIVSWNTKGLVRDCLKSVYVETDAITFEVLVVDNASSDGSAEMVAGEFPQARLLRNIENVGFARASNQAIRISRGRYVLLLNSDVIVLDGALHRMVEFMSEHPEVGTVGCQLIRENGSLEYSCRSFPDATIALFLNYPLGKIFPPEKAFRRYLLSDWDHKSARQVDWVTGACLLVRRESIEDVGLLDEDYFMFAEDVDWCYRMQLSNWKVFYVPSAKVVHTKGASYRTDIDRTRMRVEVHRSMIRFFEKHHPTTMVLGFRILAVLASLLGILKLLVKCAIRFRCGPQARQVMGHHWAIARLCLSRQADHLGKRS